MLLLPHRELQRDPLTPSSPCRGVLLHPHSPVQERPWLFWRLNPPDTLTTPQLCHSLILRLSSVLSLKDPFAPQTAFLDEEQPPEQADYKFNKFINHFLCSQAKVPCSNNGFGITLEQLCEYRGTRGSTSSPQLCHSFVPPPSQGRFMHQPSSS